jgi:hypothetical protein
LQRMCRGPSSTARFFTRCYMGSSQLSRRFSGQRCRGDAKKRKHTIAAAFDAE